MTNAQIILLESIKLMEAGKIGTTGRTITLEAMDGTKRTLQEPEQIHTYAHWKSAGYQVKKGEKATAAFTIWKQGKSKTVTDEESGEETTKPGKMFMKLSHFFTASQVEKIQR